MWVSLCVIAALAVVIVMFMSQPSFGRQPRGERLERVLRSPNYRDGRFHNLSPTPQLVSDKPRAKLMVELLLRKVDALRPDKPLPVVKTDLGSLSRDEEVVVWLGHSSLFIQTGGVRFLVDPVLVKAAPVSFVNRPFKGTDIYSPDDIPAIDYLVITHDHWDHLDYGTVKALRPRTGKVICSLGVGEHFEYWGFGKEQIIELDWHESSTLGDGFSIHCLPARHFSGRGLKPNQTLWASYMLQTPSLNIFLGGDGGYDTHFADIAARFPRIDVAFIENGQYNEEWRYIHLLPDDLVKAVHDLGPRTLFTIHNSKYALAKHPWREPLDNIAAAATRDTIPLITPLIGQKTTLNDTVARIDRWWAADAGE